MRWHGAVKLIVAATSIVFICAGVAVCAEADAVEKKLIAVGWDMPDAERLRANYESMDKLPFRGSSLRFTGRGGTPFLDFAHNREIWKPEDIDQIIEDLAAAKPKRLTDNFLDIKATPGDVDWFDDEGWAIIVDHWRAAARVAKEGGLPGLLFDPESYKSRQFGYQGQAGVNEHSFDEYAVIARQRGREVMTAVAAEYPDITIFSLFMLSIIPESTRPAEAVLAAHTYGLFAPFVDGWLDAVTENVTIIDGCEQAYRFNSEVEYLHAANLIRNTCQRFISPENRYKYRAQVQVSFGIYLDAYTNPPDSNWYIDPGDQTPVRRFEDNLASALAAADEYVWLYGEKGSWWESPNPAANENRWTSRLPGIEEVLWAAIDPLEYAASVLAEAGDATSILVNGDFSAETGKAPEGPQAPDWEREHAPASWGFWQSAAAKSEGSPGWDREVGRSAPGAGTLRKVQKGCMLQSMAVAPGERYAVAVWFRLQGAGTESVAVRWQTADGTWHAQHKDSYLNNHGADGEWKRLIGVVTVPEESGRMILLLNSDGQSSDEDVMWWDDIVVYKVD